MSASFKVVKTSSLEIAYYDTAPGEDARETIILLHGWPDCPECWDSIVPDLVRADFRCVTPYLRGFGPTRFRESSLMRSGQATALATDLVEFSEAVGISRFILVGHDWGAFAAYLAAANWPEKIKRLVTLSVPYGINTPDQLPDLLQTKAFWYQWLFQTRHGELMLNKYRESFCRFIWESWLSPGKFDPGQFEQAKVFFDNPDWVRVTLHYYRHRWGYEVGDKTYEDLEVMRLNPPPIKIPTLLIHGANDPCILPGTVKGRERHFSASYRVCLLPNVGHFPQREAPAAVLRELLEFLAD